MTRSIVVLAGGLSHERDVSIRSGRRVAESLRELGHVVNVLDLDADLIPRLLDGRPDCVVPLLHGATGEDGSLRDVLDSIGLPYVGSGPDACRLAFDKMVAKAHLAEFHVPSATAVALPHAIFRDLGARPVLDAVVARLGLPLVVKPTRGGSALGLTVAHHAEELPAAMVACFSYADTAMLEAFAPGSEVSVSVVEDDQGVPRALPGVEILPDSGIYDFASRYTAGTTEFYVPARLSAQAAQRCAEIAIAAHEGLGLRHLSRADLIVGPDGQTTFLEVNVAPGCTETSLLPQAVLAAGLDLGEVFSLLIERAIAAAGR